jgi:D-alanyl-D-alanine carboxypeptidase
MRDDLRAAFKANLSEPAAQKLLKERVMKTNVKIILSVVFVASICFVANAFGQSQTQKVDAFVREQMTANHIPGLSLAVVPDGKVGLAKGYGMANLELAAPASEKTAFAIYSITKTFTGVATMMLVEEGKIFLEDPISKHLAGLPAAWNRVTIRHLLTHTSGLKEFCAVPAKPCDVPRDFTQAEVIKLVEPYPLDFPPGDSWAYGNTGYFLLGMLIEKISGKGYEQFLRERIFAPLEMHDTRLENYTELIPHRANGSTWKDGSYRNALRVSPTLTFSLAGLVSTVLDLAKYDDALYTEKLLKKRTLDEMWTKAKLNNGETIEHGLGFGLTPYKRHRRGGHSGGHTGFSTTITRLIDEKITVIVLTNSDSDGHLQPGSFLISEIANQIASYYFSK